MLGESLRSGKTLSCGCLQIKIVSEVNKTHGGSKERLYHTWQAMKDRCQNKNSLEYKNYGGRGIKVCKEWQSYENFRNFMLQNGYNPKSIKGECTIERIDVNGNYEPKNCKIIPFSLQALNKRTNRRLTFNKKIKTATEWEQEMGFSKGLIFSRLSRGKSQEEAICTPPRRTLQYIVDGESHSCKEWAIILGIPWSTLRSKLNKGGKTMTQVVHEKRKTNIN